MIFFPEKIMEFIYFLPVGKDIAHLSLHRQWIGTNRALPPQKPLQEIGFTSFFIGAMVVIIRQHKYNN